MALLKVKDPALGKHVTVSFRGIPVGEFTEVRQKHTMNTVDYEPMGQQLAKTLDGSLKYELTLGKGWIDVDLVRTIWGRGGRIRRSDPTNVRPPRFDCIVTTKTPDVTTKETYFGVIFPDYESASKGQSDLKTVEIRGIADGGYDPGVSTPNNG